MQANFFAVVLLEQDAAPAANISQPSLLEKTI
jgi:hypothetical protein